MYERVKYFCQTRKKNETKQLNVNDDDGVGFSQPKVSICKWLYMILNVFKWNERQTCGLVAIHSVFGSFVRSRVALKDTHWHRSVTQAPYAHLILPNDYVIHTLTNMFECRQTSHHVHFRTAFLKEKKNVVIRTKNAERLIAKK